MVRKKRVNRVVKKKQRIKKTVNKTKNLVRSNKMKIKLVLTNLVLFIVLSLLSFVLYSVRWISDEMVLNLFFILAIIFGFVSVAFLIVLLIFLFLRVMRK